MNAPSSAFTRALARATATSFLFSLLLHMVRCALAARRETIFANAAPFGPKLRVGVVGRLGMYRQQVCPAWVTSLQHAELYADVPGAVHLGIHEGGVGACRTRRAVYSI